MKFFLDFFPVLGFFIAYKVYDIYVATIVLIVGAFMQTFGHRILKGKFEKMHIMTLVVSAVFGGLTLFLRDDNFIKWKVSIIMWALFLVILFRGVFLKKIALKEMFEKLAKVDFGLSDSLWKKINFTWAFTILMMGFLNLWIAYTFPLDTWVNFKVWGLTLIQLALMVITFVIIFKYMPEENRRALEESDNKTDTNQSNSNDKAQEEANKTISINPIDKP